MPGFSYGGYGDGTNWSKERGTGPAPGGGSTGNSGNHDTNTSVVAQNQVSSIRSDPAVSKKLSNLLQAAVKINSKVKLSIIRITPEGVLVMSAEGLTADQAKQIGFGGLVMGFNAAGYIGAIGDIETGHTYKVTTPDKDSYSDGGGMTLSSFLNGNPSNPPKNYGGWQPTKENVYIYTGDMMPMMMATSITYSKINNIETYSVYEKYKGGEVTYKIVVTNNNLNNMVVTTIGKGNALISADNAKKTVAHLAPLLAEAEKDVLLKASEIVISAGEKAGGYLGDKYKVLSKEISQNIKNFQGKNIRSYDDAMRSLNKVLTNPNFKINAADKNAVIKAWQSLNADDLGNKFASLGKTFKVADYAMKANNVKTKTIEGYKTGNWGPLVREVESWVLSGIAGTIALGVFSVTLGAMLTWAGLPAVAIGLLGIIMASLIASLVDDKLVDKINNEVIKLAY